MISGLGGRTYEEKLTELQLDRLEDRRQLADMQMVHKIVHGNGDLSAEDWFDRFNTDRLTRAASDWKSEADFLAAGL
jgi:hypothetical protein